MSAYKFNAHKTDAQLALELNEVIGLRRAIEKREDELKAYFKTKLSQLGQDTATCGGILISLVAKSRTDIDKRAISAAMGADFLKRFETKTTYVQVDVKEIAANLLKKAA